MYEYLTKQDFEKLAEIEIGGLKMKDLKEIIKRVPNLWQLYDNLGNHVRHIISSEGTDESFLYFSTKKSGEEDIAYDLRNGYDKIHIRMSEMILSKSPHLSEDLIKSVLDDIFSHLTGPSPFIDEFWDNVEGRLSAVLENNFIPIEAVIRMLELLLEIENIENKHPWQVEITDISKELFSEYQSTNPNLVENINFVIENITSFDLEYLKRNSALMDLNDPALKLLIEELGEDE